jgi:RAB protein geranylgeranyltransferase component A
LHVDKDDTYGGPEAALSTQEAEQWVEKLKSGTSPLPMRLVEPKLISAQQSNLDSTMLRLPSRLKESRNSPLLGHTTYRLRRLLSTLVPACYPS